MEKERFEMPEIEVIEFETPDIITTSGCKSQGLGIWDIIGPLDV